VRDVRPEEAFRVILRDCPAPSRYRACPWGSIGEFGTDHIEGHTTEFIGAVDPGVIIRKLNHDISSPHEDFPFIQNEITVAAKIAGIINARCTVEVPYRSADL
jgi:hypothetical protein